MAENSLNVMKTLVIGLGSTGTQICNILAERFQWELTDLGRIPWVRFLCIETNNTEPSVFHQSQDFRELRISKEDYSDILQNPQTYDDLIGLSTWADTALLSNLPGKEVSVGAGNIRMVGRLAFLWPENFNRIYSAVSERLNALRELQDVKATQDLGQLPDGSAPEVIFAQGDAIRVVVVGTLCGGTCSGVASDFGYFVKSIAQPQDKVTAIFTLPRHDLTSITTDRADRYKRNAYQALVELNHYQLAGRTDEPPIQFPNHHRPDTGTFPYDLIYLATPRKVGRDGEQDLNRTAAERIFLSIMAPKTDPYATAVDEAIIARDGRAHRFSSFGLSTVEFPAYQVIEACSKRLMAHALKEWVVRQLPTHEERERLDALGLTWMGITDLLCERTNGENLRLTLNRKSEEVAGLAKTSVDAATESLEKLRAAFGQWRGDVSGDLLPAGVVPHTLSENRYVAADRIMERITQDANTHLLRYGSGPAAFSQVLDRVRETIQKLQGETPKLNPDIQQRVDALLEEARVIHQSPLVGFMGLRAAALRRLIPELQDALSKEIQGRLAVEVYRALHPRPSSVGEEPGVLGRLINLVNPVAKRAVNLKLRVTEYAETLDRRATALARTVPDINGKCIFVPETAGGTSGTVLEYYERCLQEAAGDISRDWRTTRERIAAEIITQWQELPGATTRDPRNREHDWLLEELAPGKTEFIPEAQQERMERIARQPFRILVKEDVLAQWAGLERAEMEARNIAQSSNPFLALSKGVAERNRSPIKTRKVLLTPTTPGRDRFVGAVRPGLDAGEDLIVAESPDLFRAVLLEERFNFPLSGVTSVLGPGGLCMVQCGDFPVFHTRNDISWKALSDTELERLNQAQELVVVGILAGLLEAKGSALVMPWYAEGFTTDADAQRRLPLSLSQAAQSLAREGKDLDGRSLAGALKEFEHRVDAKHRKASANPKECSVAFVRSLLEAWERGEGRSVPGWSHGAGDLVARYCARTDGLYEAYVALLPPSQATIDKLRRQAGERGPNNVIIQSDGLYCYHCGGLVGADERDAARNGWRCSVDSEHYFGTPLPSLGNGQPR